MTYKPFRAAEATLPVELELPKDLTAGTYQLVISDADRFLQDEQATKPFRFTAQRAGEIFEVLKDVTAIRHDALYVRLVRQPDGVAVGHTALPQLPGSRRQILLGVGPERHHAVRQLDGEGDPDRPGDRGVGGVRDHDRDQGPHRAGAAAGPTSRPAAPGKARRPSPRAS